MARSLVAIARSPASWMLPRRGEGRRLLISSTGAVLVVGASLALARSAVGDVSVYLLALLGCSVAAIALVAIGRWRLGLYLLLLWLVLEDLPRKFLGNNMLVYFGKDILLAAVYLGFLASLFAHRRRLVAPTFLLPLVAFVAYGLVQVLNPNSPSPLFGLLGVKLYFAYIPLFLIGREFLRSRRDLNRFLVMNLSVVIPVALLAILQAAWRPGLLNPGETPEHLNLLRLMREAPLSGALVVRPAAVFVSTGRLAVYLLLMLVLAVGTASLRVAQLALARRIAFLAIPMVVGATLLLGSRGAVLYAAASLLVLAGAFLWGAPTRTRPTATTLRSIMKVGLAAGAAIIAGVALFPRALGANWAVFYETVAPWSSASELTYRVEAYPVGEFVKALADPHWLIGNGIGTASLGIQYLTAVFDLPRPGVGVESGYGTLIIELGVAGLALWLVWTTVLLWAAWRTVRILKGTTLFPVGFAIFWFAFLLLILFTYGGLQPYHNFILNAYLWLLLGILFALPRLAQSADGKELEVPADAA